ncbi:DUF3334 family protein [Thaumasiovibrio subtropicus]|uniref:DUF3334 family protein n=1 Tax=Thaumasiovibrio subtropicus TaxID=1891207 RepID=UPI000B35F6AD|nr:DUF3334 family protein [Thaumasiovibrio subtropicus]
MKKNKVVTADDILLKLCKSISTVLSSATASHVSYSGMVQKINKTSLKPDIGCFVLFDGGFSGLVVINFSSQAALELYGKYMQSMGFPSEDLAILHTSDEVSDVLGELMNQIVGAFTTMIRKELQISITQNQPKMLALNKQVVLSVDTNLDRPQVRRVSFTTETNNIFYLELAMDKTEFIQIDEFEVQEDIDPDVLIAMEKEKSQNASANKPAAASAADDVDDDLFDSLGI